MNVTHPKRFFDALGLVSLLDTQQRFQHVYEPPYAEPHVRWCERTAGVILPPTRLPIYFRPTYRLVRLRPVPPSGSRSGGSPILSGHEYRAHRHALYRPRRCYELARRS